VQRRYSLSFCQRLLAGDRITWYVQGKKRDVPSALQVMKAPEEMQQVARPRRQTIHDRHRRGVIAPRYHISAGHVGAEQLERED
jgi:hypothetical protein